MSVARASGGSIAMKQNWQAFTQVRMPSKRTSVKSTPQSCPGSRQSWQGVEVPSRGSKTMRSQTPPSASQRQSMMSRGETPLTESMRMPGSMPASQAGLPSSTAATQAPLACGLVEA